MGNIFTIKKTSGELFSEVAGVGRVPLFDYDLFPATITFRAPNTTMYGVPTPSWELDLCSMSYLLGQIWGLFYYGPYTHLSGNNSSSLYLVTGYAPFGDRPCWKLIPQIGDYSYYLPRMVRPFAAIDGGNGSPIGDYTYIDGAGEYAVMAPPYTLSVP